MSPDVWQGEHTPTRRSKANLTTSSPSTSCANSFPQLSRHQHERLDRIITALSPQAKTWAEFKEKKEELEGETETEEEEGEGEDIYSLSLKLVFQEGVTWKDKWERVQANLGSRTDVISAKTRDRHQQGKQLDVLKAKMDQVKLYESDDPVPRRRFQAQDRANGSSRLRTNPSPPRRPRSTPASLPAPTPRTPRRTSTQSQARDGAIRDGVASGSTRSFLVRRTEPGHSSSDDYAGVPSLQDLALARRRKREQERLEQGALSDVPRQGNASSIQATPRNETSPNGIDPPPLTSTPAPVARPSSKHPLLERRLAELGLAPTPSVSSDPNSPTPFTSTPPPARPSEQLVPFASLAPRHAFPHASTPRDPDLSLETSASQFRHVHLISTHFAAWRSLFEFHQERSNSVDTARESWLARCALRQWTGETARRRKLREVEIEWNSFEGERTKKKLKGIKRGVFGKWRDVMGKRLELRREDEAKARRQARESELRYARGEVVRRRNEGLSRRVLQHWRIVTLESLAVRFRLRHLPLRPLQRWRTALALRKAHIETLESVADEVWVGSEQRRIQGLLQRWKTETRLKIAENAVGERWIEGTKRGALVMWQARLQRAVHLRQLDDTASVFRARRLASSTIRIWRTRLTRVEILSEQADRLSSTFTFRFARRTFRSWSLSTIASRRDKGRVECLARDCLSRWIGKLDHLEIELEGRVLSLLATKDAQLRAVTFSAWSDGARHVAKLGEAAAAVSRKNLLSRTIGTWRKRQQQNELLGKKADVVRDFFVQRGALRSWSDRVADRKKQTWLEARVKSRKKEALQFWLARTVQSKRDRELVVKVENKRRQRTIRERLDIWKEQVIVRKELERESTILYESRLVASGFKRWIRRTVHVSDLLVRADSFRTIRAEEMRDSKFHLWLRSTRRSLELKRRSASHLEQKRVEVLDNAFGRWRERRLERFEIETRTKLNKQTKRSVFERWKTQTDTLTALQTYRRNLVTRAFASWKLWIPSIDSRRKAIDHDSKVLIRCSVERWALKTSYRRAFRNTSGRLSTPHSLHSPPSKSPRSPVFPSSSSRPSPSVVSERSRIVDSPTPSHARSTTTNPTTVHSISNRESPLPKPRPSSPSATSFIRGHRPRLSAEYVSPPPPFARRRSSFASARSAPAPINNEGNAATQDDAEGTTAVSSPRRAVRSEGGLREGRDVRKGYEALRERLRAAASASR